MIDLATLKQDDFAPFVDESFELRAESGGTIEAVLARLLSRGGDPAPGSSRVPFSAFFRGPATPILPQQICHVRHPTMGEMAIFLVPVGTEGGGGMLYEAVFS